jgi:hypothetical protein
MIGRLVGERAYCPQSGYLGDYPARKSTSSRSTLWGSMSVLEPAQHDRLALGASPRISPQSSRPLSS